MTLYEIFAILGAGAAGVGLIGTAFKVIKASREKKKTARTIRETIPVEQQQEVAGAVPETKVEVQQQQQQPTIEATDDRPTVVIADDDLSLFNNLLKIINSKYNLIQATSKADIIALTKEHSPKVVLMNVKTGDADVKEWEKLLSENKEGRFPFIFFAPHHGSVVLDISKYENKSYLIESLDPANLIAKIDEVVHVPIKV